MKYHELNAISNKNKKRVGRGIASGQGKTAGRGTKGQGSRTGKKLSSTFMGGQGALVQRIPKNRGFKSLRVKAQVVYTDQLNGVKGTTIDANSLFEAGLVATPYHTVKLIVRGEYTGKATVKLPSASAGAIKLLEKSGGKFEAVDVTKLPVSQNPKKIDKKLQKADKA